MTNKKNIRPPVLRGIEFFSAFLLVAVLGLFTISPETFKNILFPENRFHSSDMKSYSWQDPIAWWSNIGGCGAGGSGGGGGGGSGAKWVGRGVTGGIIDLEISDNATYGGDFEFKSLSAHTSWTFINVNTLGFTLPWTMKSGTYQYNTFNPPNTQRIGGFGDMGIDYSRKLGETHAGSVSLGLGLPTGKYSHRRPDKNTANVLGLLAEPSLQTGKGLFSASLSSEYTVDKDWGLIIFGTSYSAMFSPANPVKSFTKWGVANDVYSPKNIDDFFCFDGTWDSIGTELYTNKYYVRDKNFKNIGELGGDFSGNSLGANISVGYKEEQFVHSISLGYSYKIKPDWYVRIIPEDAYNFLIYPTSADSATLANGGTLTHSYIIQDSVTHVKSYYIDPVIDKNIHVLNVAYGLEISSQYFPIFLGGNMSVGHDGIMSYTGTLGVKGSFF